ncbi:MAG: TIGR02281 family clan AA aspartic protease [Sphingomonas sp.]|jgi:aspartyl protease family protein
MNHSGLDVAIYGLMLVLPLSALAARRLPLATTVKMALAWLAIFVFALLVVTAATRAGISWRSAGAALGLGNQEIVGKAVRLVKRADGHFHATAIINGVPRDMLIDTGATTISISPATAKAAGISTDGDIAGTLISTANGVVIGHGGIVQAFAIGPIRAKDLEVLVLDKLEGEDVVGMNFLSGLKSWRVEGDTLVLEPHEK